MRLLALILGMLLFALPASADLTTRRLTADLTGTYALDKSHAFIYFSISHLGFSDYMGRFNDFDALLKLDGSAPTQSQLAVTIKPMSIDTNNTELENKLRGDGYFNASRFPEIKFVSTRLVMNSRTRGKVTGNLTMLGVTKPVTLDVTLNRAGHNDFANTYSVGFSATGTIKRSDWGMSTLIPMVGDEVKLIISAEFDRRNEAAMHPAGK